MIDQFLESGHDLVEIEVEDKKPSYVAGMLKKRIQVRGLELKARAHSETRTGPFDRIGNRRAGWIRLKDVLVKYYRYIRFNIGWIILHITTFNHRQAEEILNSKKVILDEVKETVMGLPIWEHNQIKFRLKKIGWETEESISERPLKKKWRFDAYKDKVAVEIEGSTCYRSFLKFILGYNEGKIDVGILITKNGKESTRGHPMGVTKRELEDLRTIIPVPIYLIGLSK